MFANYNFDKFPLVFINFSEKINSEEEFDEFLKQWLLLYQNKRNFNFIFDTRNMKDIDIKYCFKMALFIKKLRKEKIHFLQSSFILVNNNYIQKLLDLLFMLQSPVAPVYIWTTNIKEKDKIYQEFHLTKKTRMNKNIIYIEPNCSLIPFL